MQRNERVITRYQMLCLGFLALLSPIIRLLPQQIVAITGSHAWLSALMTVIPLGLLFLLTLRFFKYALPNEGFGELFMKALGKPLGIAAIMLFTLWLIFYVAFALRSAADRYINSAFYNTSPVFFIITMLLLALVPLLGRFKNLARTAESLLPLLALVLILVFAFSFSDVDWLMLSPIKAAHLPSLFEGVPLAANVLSISIYIGFLEGRISQKRSMPKAIFIWLLLMVGTVTLLCAITVGCFGPELTAKLNYPFFMMVRNISIFNILERLESVVLAVWVITDFVLISTLLFVIISNLRLCFGYVPGSCEEEKFFSFKKGRWLIWLIAGALVPLSLLIAPNAQVFTQLSHHLVPSINNAFTFGLLPLIMIIGILRKKA